MENKEKVVRKIANKVQKKYNLSIPINFDCIFQEKGITYVEESLKTNGDGYSDLKDGQLKVVVNADTFYTPRKRFTIAHELGHIFIGWHDDVTLCQTDNEYAQHNMLDIQEKEANVFASELLMPTDFVRTTIVQYGASGVDTLIDKLCKYANTSVMAAFYALENAFSSGNVMIVYMGEMSYGQKFVAKNTMEVQLRNHSFAESCAELCMNHKEYNIGYYKVSHFKFCECPKEDRILEVYHRHQKDLLETLEELSNDNVLSILHCIRSILQVIGEKYVIGLYKNEHLFLQYKSEEVATVIKYDVEINDLEDFCLENSYEYKRVEIEKGYEILVVKERIYKDPMFWKTIKNDSKNIIKEILFSLYCGEEMDKKRRTINGIIGATNSQRKITSPQEIYDLLYKRLNRKELVEFCGHKDYEKFLSIRAYELYKNSK